MSEMNIVPPAEKQTIVVVGNGMVGLRFCQKLLEFDLQQQYRIVTFCEEIRTAYDRVGLTKYFEHRDAEKLTLVDPSWYTQSGIEIHIGDRVERINRETKTVHSTKGIDIPYDKLVLATGSTPFVPPVKGVDKKGVFVYRTIEDLQEIIEFAQTAKSAAVIGGGLLGLEAAKAAYDLGLETHVVEFAPRLMARQVDEKGSLYLVKKIAGMGVQIHLQKSSTEFCGNGRVTGINFQDETDLNVDMIIVSAGIRPRDELARDCGVVVGERGGVLIDNKMQTSDPDIYAIGEVALHEGMVYGLVAPGYEMAEALAANLTGDDRQFMGADMSTKLKLMGVDVASFGDYANESDDVVSMVFEDPFSGEYKKLIFNKEGTQLLGGILVGDASDYGTLSILAKSDAPLPCTPQELLVGSKEGSSALGGADSMPDDAQICSCNNVSKEAICSAIRVQELCSLGDVKSCTNAGTGCGGCIPLVTDLFNAEMEAAGIEVNNNLCEHFAFSRTELFNIIKIKQLKKFDDVIAECGAGNGCETCKPAVASILASLWNEHLFEHASLQDTNDRFFANMQRGGLYSIVPRVPGGEITPEKLIVLGKIGKEYNLYTKITGGQRVDLFGAALEDLPTIWERLIDAGFESGHAYGKSLRTVKSCVGSTWCRYGIGDSVGFAIRIEERYRGLRSPHKLKGAVSGCVRECAEAQSKDFGLIATENGYNLYICGNGGSKPRHADLLASDLDEATCIKYIDRFLMYYIQTADKLTRTSVWLEKLEGGLDHVKEVVIDDKLGICDELERMMQFQVETYKCEWTEVVNDPEKRRWFEQFVNTDDNEPYIEMIDQRGQQRPVDWKSDGEIVQLSIPEREDATPFKYQAEVAQAENQLLTEVEKSWVHVGTVRDFPHDGGATVKYGEIQIAVFNFSSRGEWYATQQMCPHKQAFVLSRGIIGDAEGVPKVACPLHKKTFSLDSGNCLNDEEYAINVFPVKVEDHNVFLELPVPEVLNEILGEKMCASTVCNS
ncbi:Nitrite reductase [NAD(P)H] [Polystyrenella longa]|uniref:Nitrite reductase [NAD(P)H] n=1 Tax=Polystyrenella longa TaxID=2528007 RepID=A0A518CT36_9PLAN|nr:nitrite reductase large subunit NirB [Polystyrenella longa]QDU82344.1 Nitrite reductase [NAD(P)H] [Polystyrenella longa]